MNKTSVSVIALLAGLNNGYVIAEDEDNSEDSEIEEILVTGSKRGAQSVQDTPYNISAIGSEDLEKTGINDLSELSRSVAGLEVIERGPSQRVPVIRGLSGSATAGVAQVAIYLDEIPVTTVGTEFTLYDMSRVEVLRGPQGTLYGDSSQGGTVRYITNKPTFDGMQGSVAVSTGSLTSGGTDFTSNAMINVPLVEDTLALRAVAGVTRNDGFVNRTDLNRQESDEHKNTNGRLQLLWVPSDATKVLFSYHRQDVVVDDDTLVGVDNNELPGFVRNPFKSDVEIVNLTVEHVIDAGTFTFSGSDLSNEDQGGFDVTPFNPSFDDGGNFTGFTPYSVTGLGTTDVKNYELRYASNLNGPLQFIVGVFHQEVDSIGLSISAPVGEDGVLPPGYDPFQIPEPAGQNFLFSFDEFPEGTAFFGEVSYDITDQLSVLVGARYFEVETGATQVVLTSNDVFGRPLGLTTSSSSENDDTVFKLQAAYEVNEDVLLYGTWSEGFRQGGANVLFDPNGPGVQESYGPDFVTNYEVGAKTSWADGQFILNGALYIMEWDDIQVSLPEINGANRFIDNFGAARLTGIELEGVYRPDSIPGFSVNFGLTLSEQKLTEDGLINNFGVMTGNDGDTVPGAVGESASVGIEQRFDLGGMDSYARMDLSYTGKAGTQFSELDPAFREWGDFTIINARVGVNDDKWSASVFANNLLNERSPVGWSSVFSPNTISSVDNIYITRPRTVGFSFQRYF